QEDFESSSQARTAYRLFQLANLERIAALLRDPDGTSLMGSDGLGTRGATWLFLRYVADRVPNEAALWRNLVTDARTAGMTNLQEALGFDPREWMADWSAAVYLDDAEQLDADPRFQIPSWNHRSLFPASRLLWATGYTTFPLQAHSIPAGPASRTFSLDGGAAVYLRTAVDGEERAAIRIALPGSLPAPSRLKVAVTRTE